MPRNVKESEVISGYIVRERIGSGGYGEVWKVEAPGGLFKAIKFVYGLLDEDRANREMRALHRIKGLRHPFLLSLERIDVIDGQLVIVTELADACLKDRFEQCRIEKQVGIPRQELLAYLRDAADALDYMAQKHGLQHLDIKPENLLLVGDHVKVADFGLVKDIQEKSMSMLGGLTPVYAPPELFNATPCDRSDQYSLAIVFQEMLTGALPFPGKTPAQLAAQHLNAKPNVSSLPASDQPIVARALEKDPSKRFSTCIEFIAELTKSNGVVAKGSVNQTTASRRPSQNITICGMISPEEQEIIDAAAYSSCAGDSSQPPPQAVPYAAPPASPALPHEPAADLSPKLTEWRLDVGCPDPVFTELAPLGPISDQSLCPTLVIGLGRTGGVALQKLRLRLRDRFGEAEALPAISLLLVDTDINDCLSAQRGEDGAPLSADEAISAGLRKSQDYRNESQTLLRWLSRRWLYNIPRSQKTEGLRPLGRLAFVDHAGEIARRLRNALRKISSPEAMERTSTSAGVKFTGPPRIVVVGAIGGGIGGMFVDMGFLARQILEDMGCPQGIVQSLMLHGANRNPAVAELGSVNAVATLAELYHYAKPGGTFPGDAACGLRERQTNAQPFHENYVISLGDALHDEEYETATQRVAEYLYREVATSLGVALQSVRAQSQNRNQENGDLLLRAFDLGTLGISSGVLVPEASENILSEIVDGWLMPNDNKRRELQLVAQREGQTFVHERNWNLDNLARSFLAQAETLLGEPLSKVAQRLMNPDGGPLDATRLATLEPNVLAHRLNELFGLGTAVEGQKNSQLSTALEEHVNGVGQTILNQTKEWLAALLESLGKRVVFAEAAGGAIAKFFQNLGDEIKEQLESRKNEIAQLEPMLGVNVLPIDAKSKAHLSSIRKAPQEFETRFQRYAHLRLALMVFQQLSGLARSLKSNVSLVSEQLMETRRELKTLRAEFHATDSAHEEECLAGDLEKQFEGVLRRGLREHQSQLVTHVEQWLQSEIFAKEGGFSAVISVGGERRIALVERMRRAARKTVLGFLKQANPAQFMVAAQKSHEAVVTQFFESARPELAASASGRVFTVSPEGLEAGTTNGRIRKWLVDTGIAKAPIVASENDGDFLVLHEWEQIPLSQVAYRLIDGRRDLLEYASRLFTRIDVHVGPLAPLRDVEAIIRQDTIATAKK